MRGDDGVTGNREQRRFLLVRTGQARYALPLAAVRRVLRSLQIFPVPAAQPQLVGLAQWRGEPMPILDLAALVRETEPPPAADPTVVVVRVGPTEDRELVGLVVTEVESVVKATPSLGEARSRGLVRGEIPVDDSRVPVVDPGGIVREDR